MAMDFPSNPIDGQIYNNFIYSSSKGVWQAKPLVGSVATNSAVAPTIANPGDFWYNTNTGTVYNYVDDGTSRQWVEIISSPSKTVDYASILVLGGI